MSHGYIFLIHCQTFLEISYFETIIWILKTKPKMFPIHTYSQVSIKKAGYYSYLSKTVMSAYSFQGTNSIPPTNFHVIQGIPAFRDFTIRDPCYFVIPF